MAEDTLIRQYRIVTKTPTDDNQEGTMLQPGVHAALYNIPEIREAVAWLETQQHVEMIGIRIGPRFYGIVVIRDKEVRAHHFQLADFDG